MFQQDGAPCHTAKSVTQWLRDCEVDFISNWPSNSPGINPTEYLRSILKQQLQGMDTSSVLKLEAAIWEEWDNFNHKLFKNLTELVHSQLKE